MWEMGYRIDASNAVQLHEQTLSKIAVYRWCALSPEAQRLGEDPEELWKEAKDKSLNCLRTSRRRKGATHSVKGGGLGGMWAAGANGQRAVTAAAEETDDPYWVSVGIKDSEEAYFEMFKDCNKKAECKNCYSTGPGHHSVAFCRSPRRPDLLCQLCFLGAHREKDCNGFPGVPPFMWKAHRRMFIGRVASSENGGGGGGDPSQGK